MAAPRPSPECCTYSFGPFRLVPERQLLLCNGVPVRIGGRALDILALLVRRSGEIVSKNELFDFCWPDTFVHEANLKVNVASLRRALAEGSDEAYIATVAGRGYRFVAPVKQEAPEQAPIPRSSVASTRTLPKPPLVIGRTTEISRIASVLADTRCVSIVGPGGVGKTTIAIAVAHHELPNYADGVCFVDLSTVGDPQYAIAAIAAGVAARQSSEDTLSEVIDLLHGRQMLIVLDNCEHLAPIVTVIVNRLLAKLPTIKVLATSREPLRTVSEHIYRLPTLDVPTESQIITAKEALDFAAVQLFVARAQERGSYELSDADAPLVSAICRRLDGIALAIELAASKTITFGVPTLLTMLEQRFLLLSNGTRAAPLRQQTLLATLDWSYRLLSDDEASLLRLLSVFAGVFQLQDAVAMSKAADFDAAQTIDTLERLTNKSIVGTEYHGGKLSYRLLESTRAYSSERLADTAERGRALECHARHILASFERAAEERAWREKQDWMSDYAGRVDDLRNVLAWAFGHGGDQLLGIKLTAAAIPLWIELSSVCEMQSRIERALIAGHDLGDCPADLTMKLIAARASGMSFAQHLAPATEAAWQECYRLGVTENSTEYQLHGLWGLAAYLIYVGRLLEGISKLHQFMAIAEAQGDWPAVAEGNRMMAMAEMYIGQVGNARQRLERLAARHERPKDPVRFARFQAERGVGIRCSFAVVLWISGDPDRAMRVAQAAVDRAAATGHVVSHSNALAVSAIPIAIWTGNLDDAAKFLAMLEENGRQEDIGIWREVCRFFKSALRAKRREAGGAAEFKARLHDLIAARNLLRAPMHYSMVAEALLEAGAADDARELVEQARSLAHAQVANWCLPEICRIAALIALHTGNRQEAERQFGLAIAKANEMGALTLELRAALALSRMLEAAGRQAEALDLLTACCAKFSGDAAWEDLAEARNRRQRLSTISEASASYA
ncbi:winged helix-turn-helix domain-containing protein [Bosea sp. BK604]|uniref:ATP-binding protein n=1 Tax=Bosea sp. BK604 TaxID=2512180 RepID=UPI00104F2050|nr:winged helix-turn-helix domain-containing protein [Bosea sp. BK604]TCR61537.1 putative ATPase [Bosea sp. BK604]